MIVKFQQGGGIGPSPNYTIINPVSMDFFNPTESPTTKSGKKADSEEPDLQKILMDADLLPNDTAYLAQQINKIERLSSIPGFTGVDAFMAKFQHDLSKAKYHKDAHTKAVAQAEKVNALPEVAITKDNKLVGINTETGKIQYLTIEEAKQGKHRILSNNEVKDLNSQELGYTFDTTLLETLQNGTSMSQVNKDIKEASMNIGTSHIEQKGYTLQMAQDIQAGLRIAQNNKEGMPLTGLYKSGQIKKDQLNQTLLALDYIYQIIPDNAKTLLTYKTGSEQAAKELIFKRLGAQANPYTSFDTTYELDLDGNKPGAKEKETKKESFELTPAMALALGRGPQSNIKINVGNSHDVNVNARYSVLNDGSKNLGYGSTLVDVTNSDYAGVLDFKHISFGGERLDTDLGYKVLLKDADVYTMELPIDVKAAEKGLIKPDLFLTERLEKADNYIRLHKITDKNEINKVYRQNDLPPKFDESGNFNITNWGRFARLTGIVEETALNENAEVDTSVFEIQDENRRKSIETTLKKNDKEYSLGNGFLGMGVDKLYEGAIYIPIRQDVIAASLGSGNYFDVYGTTDSGVIREMTEEEKKLSTYTKPNNLSALRQ